MFTYESNSDLQSIGNRITGANRIVVTTHSKPDGDAMGSVMALTRSLQEQVTVEPLIMGPVTSAMRALAGSTPWIDADQQMPGSGEDLVLVVDTGAFSQVEPIADWLRERYERVIVLDHHASGDDMGCMRYVDPTAASASMIVMDLLDVMGLPIAGGSASVAEAIFCGLATDTGWFRFSNADARAFAAAARLLQIGVDRDGLYRTIEETARPARLVLQARALQSLEYVMQEQGAIMRLQPSDFAESGGSPGELAGTVNIPMAVGTVEFSILLYSEQGKETKLSLRSKPARQAGGTCVDVSALAKRFGGGGHVHAAGARIAGDVDSAREKVLKELADLELPS